MAVTQTQTNVVKFTAVADAITEEVDVNFLYWVNKTGGADEDLVVTDTAGNILWVDTADAVNYHNFCPLKNKVTGIIAQTLDSGVLYVYKEAEIPMQV